MQTKQAARARAEVILKVRAGAMTVTEAAAVLGVSRKTYYEWEERGLGAMLRQLEDQAPGRPAAEVSPVETALTAKVAELEAKLKVAEETAEIRAVLRAMEGASAKKSANDPRSPPHDPGTAKWHGRQRPGGQRGAEAELSATAALAAASERGCARARLAGPEEARALAAGRGAGADRAVAPRSETHARHDGVTGRASRCELARLVAAERGRQNLVRRQVCKHVTWHAPNVAWALDATERGRDRRGRKLYVHAVQDLCSRYRFAPLAALESKGSAVAAHLATLFRRHGAPLFLKRDNGSPLNHAAVDAVLADFGVIPLNSPAHYPRYNGAIEKGIREMKAALGECLVQPALWQPNAVAPYLLAVQHALNCRPRRSLHGHTACEAYYHQPHARRTKRERLAVFEWIRIHAIDRVNQLETCNHRSVAAAWRLAAETWLRCQGLITVSINQNVLPNLPRKYVCS